MPQLGVARGWSFSLWFVLLAVLAERPAGAARRILVLEFEGAKVARRFQDLVVATLEKRDVEIVEDAELSLGANANRQERVELAAQRDAEALVTGVLKRGMRSHFILTVTMTQKSSEHVVRLDLGRRAKASKAIRLMLQRRIKAKLVLEKAPSADPTDPPLTASDEAEDTSPPEKDAQRPTGTGAVPLAVVFPGAALPPRTDIPASSVQVTASATGSPQAPSPTPAWENFALMRPAAPASSVTLRNYWDSRDMAALEQTLGFRAPLDFYFFGRTTLRSEPMASHSDLSTFVLDAYAMSPAIYSFGLAANAGGVSGSDNDALRLGVLESFLLSFGPARLFSNFMFLPYDSTRHGGRAISQLVFTAGPFRSEWITVYGWPALRRIDEPLFFYFRPDLRMTVWWKLGAFAQYEYNSALDVNGQGVRFGAEFATKL